MMLKFLSHMTKQESNHIDKYDYFKFLFSNKILYKCYGVLINKSIIHYLVDNSDDQTGLLLFYDSRMFDVVNGIVGSNWIYIKNAVHDQYFINGSTYFGIPRFVDEANFYERYVNQDLNCLNYISSIRSM